MTKPFHSVSILVALLLAFAVAPVPAGHAAESGKKGKPAASTKRRVPPKTELDALVRGTLLDVDKGLETKDFAQLYGNLAPTWRRSLKKEALASMFVAQLEEKQRTNYAATNEIVYDPAPFIDSRGLLVAGGHLPGEPEFVLFRIKYYNEGGWKPFGIAVRVQTSYTAPSRLPEKDEQELPPVKGGAAAASPAPGAPPSPAPAVSPAPGASPSASPAPAASPAAGAAPAPVPAASASPGPSASPSPKK